MKYTLFAVIMLIVPAAGALMFAWSGLYDIAATSPHWDITSSFIETLRDRSISIRSDGASPPALNKASTQGAIAHYHDMCRLCHGAPGYPPEEFARGLYPKPPLMSTGRIQKERSGAEIHWIVKHGIKMTAMPAFGPTHSDSELKGITALTIQMGQTSAEGYRQRVQEADLKNDGGHRHGSDSPEHGETEGHHD